MGDTYLSVKEAVKLHVLNKLINGELKVREAAEALHLSERHIKRLKAGVINEGPAFLVHKNRGRKPAHAVADQVRHQVVELALDIYRDASCQHMAELIEERQGIHLSAKTISRILKAADIPLRYTHKSARRRRTRDRKPQEGMLIQVDASPYDWLEERGPKLTLHGAIDDATGKLLGLYFTPEECTYGYLQVLFQILENHGVPSSLYSDQHTIFFSPKKDKLTIEQELAGEKVNLTQFGRALKELAITHLAARSPQAKGRVERLWSTLQGRLLIELRIANVSTPEEANRFLPGFIDRFNRRFAVEPTDPTSAFLPSPSRQDLTTILSFKETRKASAGSTISYFNHTYQLIDSRGVVPLRNRANVTVITKLDGTLCAIYEGKIHALAEISKPIPIGQKKVHGPKKAKVPQKPPEEHPWRKPIKHSSRRSVEETYFDQETRQFWEEIYAQR